MPWFRRETDEERQARETMEAVARIPLDRWKVMVWDSHSTFTASWNGLTLLMRRCGSDDSERIELEAEGDILLSCWPNPSVGTWPERVLATLYFGLINHRESVGRANQASNVDRVRQTQLQAKQKVIDRLKR